ncbi:helix-turn-helix domain-containing protein [Pseudoclavibacter helvolus]|uniref:Transcriptional regulator with XRE-family HTH domain n=1 Tax=Pseudoclavibacter helvolus TaxID=255205 RepID=A0A7W4US44_9MICO|nr:helix-turn-helix transcriptional regulator [Pseudoclavibacter helvolus]MBB2959632.1 transcriptional regulator with XRE-family HTH domain [Pseudoclavibacter helvolus]
MGRPKQDAAGVFARSLSRIVRRELGDRNMSRSKLAELMGKSEPYVRARINDQTDFTLNDLENIARAFDIAPIELLRHAEIEVPSNVTQLRTPDWTEADARKVAKVSSSAEELDPNRE